NVYKNRTLPNVTTATLVSYVKKNQTLAANDTITVAALTELGSDPGTGAASTIVIGLLVANTYFSVEGSTGYLYYTVQVGTEIKTYKEKAPDGTGLTADKNSIIKIDTVSETNALEIKTKTIYTPGTLAALSSPGSAKAYVAALDGLQIFLGQSNNAAGAWDATVTEFSLDGTKIYKVAADGTAVAATSADLTVTAVGSTTKGGFTVIAFLSTNSANPDKITHLFIVG
ncbi:MAG: hypothetical protein LBT60_03125, partial [Oscillospiraceae bacterium]|nr:hypothetical protein [Oscillospiraceae bacterium]